MQNYYLLLKPGIILGNLITTACGFALASRGHFDPFLFLIVLLGLTGVIGSACVFNNYIDREADAKMERTKNRSLASGRISHIKALAFGVLLGAAGFLSLAFYTNILTLGIAAFGFFFYVIVYSFWKYLSVQGTLVGSFAGAAPPVIGYTAVSGHLDWGAMALFFILVLWQMPHFYAIALLRQDDYAAADIPVLPVKRGIYATKVQMLLYTIAFMASAPLLYLLGHTGEISLALFACLGVCWVFLSVQGFSAENDRKWAGRMFRFSLIAILVVSFSLSIDTRPVEAVEPFQAFGEMIDLGGIESDSQAQSRVVVSE